TKGQMYQGYSCFDNLGVVNFEGFDRPIIERAQKAVEWLRLLEKEGSTWRLDKVPLPREELYPNMCNTHDAPWHHVKEVIAHQIQEITLLWMIGPKARQ